MIKVNREYLWKQLNGPQITAFRTAIRQYHKDAYDKLIEYFSDLSIDRETGAVLGFVGRVMLFPPPLVIEVGEYDDWFRWSRQDAGAGGRTDDPPPQAPYGFSDVQDSGLGGRFPLSDDQTEGKAELPDSQYREILQEMAKIDGYTGSTLDTLDFLADKLLVYPDGKKIYYEISWYDMEIPDTNYGDLLLTVAEDAEYEILIFKLIINTVFQSQPVVYIDVDTNLRPAA